MYRYFSSLFIDKLIVKIILFVYSVTSQLFVKFFLLSSSQYYHELA